MESSTTSSRFRFRDHEEADDSAESDDCSLVSSVSIDNDDECELESMTGKGIKRLCMELLELKATSDEDFHRNIFANYSAFVGIIDEVRDMNKEIMYLKTQISTQKRLVKDLIHEIYQKALSEETIGSIIGESDVDEPPPVSELAVHINDVLEMLDMLISENRIDEVIDILEMEEENIQKVHLEDNVSSDLFDSYKNTIFERKAIVILELTLLAENSRIPAPELQKALVGLCRLGDSYLAMQLLIKYYHSRIATGIQNLQNSKLHGVYIRELSKFVFSMISQAARSFMMLYGETSPYASEIIQWVHEEIEGFAVCFTQYIKSIPEISDGLSTAVEAMQFAMSHCSLLEAQRLALLPCLIGHIHPCMEEVLLIHVDHFKKVVGIFTKTDTWVLGRYLLSGILNQNYSLMVVGEQPQYCHLTSSGWKFVTLLQVIAEEFTPLIALQMEGSILRGLMDLFMGYIAILERAMTSETNVSENKGSKVVLAESVPQQVSILANLSTLEHFFCSTIRNIYEGNYDVMKDQSVSSQQQDIDNCIMSVQEVSGRLRAHFYQQFICKLLTVESGFKLNPEMCVTRKGDTGLLHNMMPSGAFQVLFLELHKIDNHAEDNVFDVDWLMELLRELISAIFIWISKSKEIWETKEEKFNLENSEVFNQFILDMHFLVEIMKYYEYFSNDPLLPINLMESIFLSAGQDSKRDIEDDQWAIRAATEAIQRLLEYEKAESAKDEIIEAFVQESPRNNSEHEGEIFQDETIFSGDSVLASQEDVVATNGPEDAINDQKGVTNIELQDPGQPSHLLEDISSSPAREGASHLADIAGDLEDIGSESAAYDKFHFFKETSIPALLLSAGIVEAPKMELSFDEEGNSEHHEAMFHTDKLKGDTAMELPDTETEFSDSEEKMKDTLRTD